MVAPLTKFSHKLASKTKWGAILLRSGVICYLGALVLAPLILLTLKGFSLSWSDWKTLLSEPRLMASLKLSFATAAIAAAINTVFGFMVAFVLCRYDFFGRRFLDALVDLPFALPTAVAGISLTAIFAAEGVLGRPLLAMGIKVAFTPLGITVALIFIGMPFVVRTLQPVLMDFDPCLIEAARALGASRFQIVWRIILPELTPAMISGFALALSRGLGEYGSVVFISGNMPMRTEVASFLIVTKLEQYDYAGATAIALIMLGFSFLLLVCLHSLMWQYRRRHGQTVQEVT